MATETMMPMRGPEGEAPSEAQDVNASKTALLPLALFPQGANPGDNITLRVVSVNGDEVIAELASEPAEPQEEPMSADEEIDMMAAQNE